MAAKKRGAAIGAVDEYLVEICVGDEVQDAQGKTYTINKNSWCKPLDGGSSRSLANVGKVVVTRRWDAEQQKSAGNPEKKAIEQIRACVKDAGDRLVDELRCRGYKVTCTKLVEKVIFEEVSL